MNLFGFQFKRIKSEDNEQNVSFTPIIHDDGAMVVAAGGIQGTYVDLEGSARTEAELVTKYREMSLNPELDSAIDDIVNESIVRDEDLNIVKLNLDHINLKPNLKAIIHQEFDNILQLFEFGTHSYDIFRKWYVDGRLYYHVIIDDKHPELGIKELRYIDPRKIRKVREVKRQPVPGLNTVTVVQTQKEYYLFNEKGFAQNLAPQTPANSTGVTISADAILHCTSGVTDKNNQLVLSYLHTAIKPLNQLRTLEDATLIYRISRAPERRVFYIDVGNLPKMKAEQYLKDIMTRFKNRVVYDSATGEVRDDRKFMCYALDTKIPLLDGRTLEIAEIIKEYEQGKINWVYSCDPITGAFVPGPVSWAGITKKNSDVVRVTFDNGKSVVCTPDHKFPVWGKGFVEAQHLAIGESLIPGYRRFKEITKGGIQYEQIFKNDTKTWEFTHREIVKFQEESNIQEYMVNDIKYLDAKKSVIHHRNFNRLDNTPNNLVLMNHKDHMDYHKNIQSIQYTSEIIDILNQCAVKQMKVKDVIQEVNSKIDLNAWRKLNADKNPKNRDVSTLVLNTKDITRIVSKNGFSGWRAYCQFLDFSEKEPNGRTRRFSNYRGSDEWKAALSEAAKNRKPVTKTWKILTPNGDIQIVENLNAYCRENGLNRNNIKRDYGSKGFKAETLHNHKVVSVEFLEEKIAVAALTIDQEETYHSHHTYLLDAGVYTKNTMLEDFWLPRREGGKGTQIETLPPGQNLGQLEDVKYFQRNLYKSLKIPINRIEPEQTYALGRATEITRDEVKFSKFVQRLQTRFSLLFLKALEKQLILKNIVTIEDWNTISGLIAVEYVKDNYYSELKELEIVTNRMNVVASVDPFVGKYFSLKWVMREVLQMRDADIEAMQREIDEEIQEGLIMSPEQLLAIQNGPPEPPKSSSNK